MKNELTSLYIELTNSRHVVVTVAQDLISIFIVSDWFNNQSEEERLDYLAEGIQVAYPELTQSYKIHFVALTTREAFEFIPARVA